ncbi:MAG: serine protease [Planctomycetota bacterium]|nr:serine protease [Planctomycetota bacterium]
MPPSPNLSEAILVNPPQATNSNETFSPRVFLTQLTKAVNNFERAEVAALCQRLASSIRLLGWVPPLEFCQRTLSLLRRKRHFPQILLVADAFLELGQDSPQIRRQYIQALIDEGHIAAGVAMARESLVHMRESPERMEVLGLLGRGYKQWFMQSGDPDYLYHSLDAYGAVYQKSPEASLWQGINLVALLSRAERDGISVAGRRKSKDLAREILAIIEKRGTGSGADNWDRATAMEACIALGRHDQAMKWARDYSADPSADAFELTSALRQLTQVWRLDKSTEQGRQLLSLLEARLLRQQGGQVLVDPASVAATRELSKEISLPGQEKVFGADGPKTLEWYLKGLELCHSVARFENRTGRGLGTGFVIRGGDLKADWNDDLLIVTNAHVLGEKKNPAALSKAEAFVRFEYGETGGHGPYPVQEILATSDPFQLDFTIARINAPNLPVKPCPLVFDPIERGSSDRLYAIGYPFGAVLSLSLNDNELLDFVAPRVHYRTPTQPGSSGSPIFNDQWQVVALHHAGRPDMPKLTGEGTYEANEGIWLGAIREKVNGRQ